MMVTLKFNIEINAPREKVWAALWDDQSYREWTSVFTKGSYAKSDWQEGSRIDFLNPSGNGIFASIDKKVLNDTMVFKHAGEIKNGEDVPGTDWAGSTESYFLSDRDGGTLLYTELQSTEDFQQYFNDTFPKAMNKVKEIAER
ncbi:MAG TPA: ATPase [Chitinophagaceae bacterium]|nr:ATPase [Chitinophagaceae bacterium]